MKVKLNDELRFLYYLVSTIIFIGSCVFLIYSIWINEITAIVLCSIFSLFAFFFRRRFKKNRRIKLF